MRSPDIVDDIWPWLHQVRQLARDYIRFNSKFQYFNHLNIPKTALTHSFNHPSKSLSLAILNVRGYRNNQTSIEKLLNEEMFDILVLTETWLKKPISSSNSNYGVLDVITPSRSSGIRMCHRKSLRVQKVELACQFKHLMVTRLVSSAESVFIICVYLQPTSTARIFH